MGEKWRKRGERRKKEKERGGGRERHTDFLVTTFLPLMYLVEVEVERKLPPPVGPPKLVLENWENLQHNTTHTAYTLTQTH